MSETTPTAPVQNLVQLRRKGWSEDSDVTADIAVLREGFAVAGYTVSDIDIEWAYGEMCQDTYGASWLVMEYWCRGISVPVKNMMEYLELGN